MLSSIPNAIIALLYLSAFATSAPGQRENAAHLSDVVSSLDSVQEEKKFGCWTSVDSIPNNEKPVVLCAPDGRPEIEQLKDLHFLGWHGTLVKHIESLQNSVQIIDPPTSEDGVTSPTVASLRHGPGFYTTDSINAARHFQAHSYLKCTAKKQYPDPTISYRSTTGVAMTDDPSCAPAMCAVFMTKEFWKVVPKVFLHRFKDKTKSIKLRYNLPLLEAELTGYMRRNNLAVQPLTFSEVSYKNFNMQAVVPKEHLGRIVAVCGYDSLGKEYLKNLWMDRVLNKLVELDLEKEGTFGKMFGDYLPTMFNLDYWAVMKIHSGNEYQPSRRSNAGWDMDDIGEE